MSNIATKSELCEKNQHKIHSYLSSGNQRYAVVYILKEKLDICKDCPDYTQLYGKHLCVCYDKNKVFSEMSKKL